MLQIVCGQPDFDTIEKLPNQIRVTANRNALIESIEVVVIKSKAYRKSLNYKSRKVFAITSPLLLGIALN